MSCQSAPVSKWSSSLGAYLSFSIFSPNKQSSGRAKDS
ncbi:unnamed protein product, partial [Staurois parvus]